LKDIKITVAENETVKHAHIAPSGMGLSLMEFLKASGYDIPATCGGMALCATCHVEVLQGFSALPGPVDDEQAMLDTLPHITEHSRLSCQIRLEENTPELVVRLMGEG
jgi:2Fe-2S ferredoxin